MLCSAFLPVNTQHLAQSVMVRYVLTNWVHFTLALVNNWLSLCGNLHYFLYLTSTSNIRGHINKLFSWSGDDSWVHRLPNHKEACEFDFGSFALFCFLCQLCQHSTHLDSFWWKKIIRQNVIFHNQVSQTTTTYPQKRVPTFIRLLGCGRRAGGWKCSICNRSSVGSGSQCSSIPLCALWSKQNITYLLLPWHPQASLLFKITLMWQVK